MNVLGLFNGMGGGNIALTELGIKHNYFSSEVDKFANKQVAHNFPDTVHLGSVLDVSGYDLPRMDLILAGSPCQGFSFAGKRKGAATKCEIEITTFEQYIELKTAGFEFEGQSYLFWEFIRILNECRTKNPDVIFLLENVEMGKKWEGVLSRAVGCLPVHINSNRVSAQNRQRVYWSNIRLAPYGMFSDFITDIPQPRDRKIFLKDILETDVPEKYFLSEKMIKGFVSHAEKHKAKGNGFTFEPFENFFQKSKCLTTNEGSRGYNNFIKISKDGTPKPDQTKASCFTAGGNSGGNHSDMDLIWQLGHGFNDGGLKALDGKVPTLTKNSWEQNNFLIQNYRIRRLTPTEAAKLQTVPAWYRWIVSDTQIYKMCGNGWTIEVIKHILSFIKL